MKGKMPAQKMPPAMRAQMQREMGRMMSQMGRAMMGGGSMSAAQRPMLKTSHKHRKGR